MADDETPANESPPVEPPAEEPATEEPPVEEPPAEIQPAAENAEAPAAEGTDETAPTAEDAPADAPIADAPIADAPTADASPADDAGGRGGEEGAPAESSAEENEEPTAEDTPKDKDKDDSICSLSTNSEEQSGDKRHSQQYAEILLKIVTQNTILTELKQKIKEKSLKCPRSVCEDREIYNLKICFEQENLKLQTLVRCATSIQARDPDQKWPPIPIETTLDEDRMTSPFDYKAMTSKLDLLSCDAGIRRGGRGNFKCSSSETTTETTSQDSYAKSMKTKKRGVAKELCRSYNMQEKLVADNADLEGDRYKLQEELLSRDRMIECLQQKVCLMHAELTKICRKAHGLDKKEDRNICDELPQIQSRMKKQGSTTECLSSAMDRIQNALDGLKLEVDNVKKCRERGSQASSPQQNSRKSEGGRGGRNEVQDMKERYADLLEDYTNKERELCSLKEKVNAFIEGKPMQQNDNNEMHEAEVKLLRQKLKETREEQDEFKVIICEQAKQTDEYREKYMCSLQKIEELKCILQKMEVDNKRVEDQINLEIQRIKSKFQEKLQDWAHLPKMLENEQIKLSQCCKEKEDLESKLRIVCRELKSVKNQKAVVEEEKEDPDKMRRLEQELAELKPQYETLLEAKNRVCEKYDQIKRELDCLRQESAKIICRLKERAHMTQCTLKKHIDELEHELAQCRATACLSIADREEVIKDMQSQLNCLGVSFDSAQKQIKSLKDHISYLSSGKVN